MEEKAFTAVIERDGKFIPFLLMERNIPKHKIIKCIEGQNERNWHLACKAAEALNNF